MHVAFSRQSVSHCFHYHLVPDRPAEDTGLQGTTAHQILLPLGDPRRTLRSSPPLPNPGPRPKIFSSSTNLVVALLRRAPSHQTPLTISEPSLSASYRPSIHRRPWNLSALRSLSARLCLSNPYRSRLPLASFVHHALSLHLDLDMGLDSSSKALFCFQRQFVV